MLGRALADPIGAIARASQLERLAADREPLDQPDRDLEAIRTLDLDTLRSLATRELQPDRMIAVLRGPRVVTDRAIRALGIDLAKVELEAPPTR